MRKNDERNPRPVRGSGEKASQNRGLSWVWSNMCDQLSRSYAIILSGLTRSKTSVKKEKTGENTSEVSEIKIYDEGSKVSGYLITPLAPLNRTRELDKEPESKFMTLLKRATQAFQVAFSWQPSFNQAKQTQANDDLSLDLGLESNDTLAKQSDFHSQESDQKNHELLSQVGKVVPNDEENFPLVNNLTNKVSEEEEEQRLLLELEDIMSEVGEDGFTLRDKSILRSNLPIPKKYDSYELEAGQLKKFTPINYVPEDKTFVVDEEREQDRRDQSS